MGWFSDLFGDDDDNSVTVSYQAAANKFNELVPPSLSSTAMTLSRMVSAGEITPVEAQAYLLRKSEMEGVTVDPKLYQAQLDSLTSLQEIGQNKGLTAMDRAQLNDINIEEATKARGAREALMNEAAARGTSGSGLEMAQQLMNQQSAADRASKRGTDVAAAAQQRALEAIQQSGALAGSMRTQDFNEQQAKAQAADAIAKFNAQMQAQTSATNAQANNAAQEANITNKLKVQAVNLDQQKTEEKNRIDAINNLYDQQFRKVAGQSGAFQDLGKAQAGQNASQQKTWTSTASGVLNSWDTVKDIGTTVYDFFSDEEVKEKKKELTDDELQDMLNNLTGFTYKYDKEHGGKPGIGVMAQDIEQGPLEDKVIDTPNGKMVMGDKEMLNAMMGALAQINKRVNNLEGK